MSTVERRIGSMCSVYRGGDELIRALGRISACALNRSFVGGKTHKHKWSEIQTDSNLEIIL